MSNLKDELVGAYNKVVKRRDEFLHNSKVWIFRFKEIGEEVLYFVLNAKLLRISCSRAPFLNKFLTVT